MSEWKESEHIRKCEVCQDEAVLSLGELPNGDSAWVCMECLYKYCVNLDAEHI